MIEPCDKLLELWAARRHEFLTLSKMAFDLLSIPLMSAECERVFSMTKQFVTERRNGLKDGITEASTLLRHWYKMEMFD